MLVKILAVVAILAVIAYFKAKGWFRLLMLILGIGLLIEYTFMILWYFQKVDAENIFIYEEETAMLEQQITEIKEELLQGNMSKERLENILEEYHELQGMYEMNMEEIEDLNFWRERGRENVEKIIFLK